MTKRLPHAVYMQMKYKIYDYDRLLEQRELILEGKLSPGFRPGGRSGKSDPTAGRALRLVKLDLELKAIKKVKERFELGIRSAVAENFDAFLAFKDFEYFKGHCKRRVDKKSWTMFRRQLAWVLATYYGLI